MSSTTYRVDHTGHGWSANGKEETVAKAIEKYIRDTRDPDMLFVYGALALGIAALRDNSFNTAKLHLRHCGFSLKVETVDTPTERRVKELKGEDWSPGDDCLRCGRVFKSDLCPHTYTENRQTEAAHKAKGALK